MGPPSPFTSSMYSMTPIFSRQLLGSRVPVSLRVMTKPTKSLPATNTTVISAQQTRGLAFGKKGNDMGESKTHVTDKPIKDSDLNAQTSASTGGYADSSAAKGDSSTVTGHARSQAATQKDERNSTEKTKQEHPEAPGPIIGMTDERGGRGH